MDPNHTVLHCSTLYYTVLDNQLWLGKPAAVVITVHVYRHMTFDVTGHALKHLSSVGELATQLLVVARHPG